MAIGVAELSGAPIAGNASEPDSRKVAELLSRDASRYVSAGRI
jgi:hypothetical protein